MKNQKKLKRIVCSLSNAKKLKNLGFNRRLGSVFTWVDRYGYKDNDLNHTGVYLNVAECVNDKFTYNAYTLQEITNFIRDIDADNDNAFEVVDSVLELVHLDETFDVNLWCKVVIKLLKNKYI